MAKPDLSKWLEAEFGSAWPDSPDAVALIGDLRRQIASLYARMYETDCAITYVARDADPELRTKLLAIAAKATTPA